MNSFSMLVVEDSPADAALVGEYLRDVPGAIYELETVETLGEALSVLSRRNVDVVLLDLSLPDSSGIETVRTVIGRHPRVAIVVLTGLQDEQLALQAVRYGAQDYLDKRQLTSSMLHRSIAYSLERKKILREKENLLADLTTALDRIEMLQSMLPVCPCCNKIQDADNNWLLGDEYFKAHRKTSARQRLCPECLATQSGGKTTS